MYTALICFNHEYPLHCIAEEPIFKKFLGRVRSQEVTCTCPECGMRITYSFKIKSYKKGK